MKTFKKIATLFILTLADIFFVWFLWDNYNIFWSVVLTFVIFLWTAYVYYLTIISIIKKN
jgi:hypothetical protein